MRAATGSKQDAAMRREMKLQEKQEKQTKRERFFETFDSNRITLQELTGAQRERYLETSPGVPEFMWR